MTFSEKEKLVLLFERWAEVSHLSDSPLNTIAWLDKMGLLSADSVSDLLRGERHEK